MRHRLAAGTFPSQQAQGAPLSPPLPSFGLRHPPRRGRAAEGRYLPSASSSVSAAAILSAPPTPAFSLSFSPPFPTDRRPLPPISARARRAPPSDWQRAGRAANWDLPQGRTAILWPEGGADGGARPGGCTEGHGRGGRRQLPRRVLPRAWAADTRTLPLGKAESRGRLGVMPRRTAPPPSLRGEKAVPPPFRALGKGAGFLLCQV